MSKTVAQMEVEYAVIRCVLNDSWTAAKSARFEMAAPRFSAFLRNWFIDPFNLERDEHGGRVAKAGG